MAWPWLYFAVYGTDQDLAQRMLSTGSKWAACRSLLGGIGLGVIISLVLAALGMLLWLYYQRPEMLAAGNANLAEDLPASKILLHYLIHDAPAGLAGLLIAALAAAAVSSLTSEMNALAAVLRQDCLGERGAPRLLVLLSAGALLVCGLLCVSWHGREGLRLIPFAMKMMTLAYGGLVGVFVAALIPGRRSALAGHLALIGGVLMIVGGEFMWRSVGFYLAIYLSRCGGKWNCPAALAAI